VNRVRVVNRTRGCVVASRAAVASTPLRRALGLIARTAWGGDDGIVLEPCVAVHSMFMRMPIDVLYIDEHGQVLHAVSALRPWRLAPVLRSARRVVELPAGTLSRTGTGPGDSIALVS
jgi:uncharacterized membrane protein (UPF0127 family)